MRGTRRGTRVSKSPVVLLLYPGPGQMRLHKVFIRCESLLVPNWSVVSTNPHLLRIDGTIQIVRPGNRTMYGVRLPIPPWITVANEWSKVRGVGAHSSGSSLGTLVLAH